MTATYITDEMSRAVGLQMGRMVSYPVAESDIRRWATAIYFPDDPPPLFWDADHAAQTVHGGIVAPEEFNPFAWMVAEPHGMRTGYAPGAPTLESKLGIAEVGTEFQLNGGVETEFGTRMRPGDVITSATVLSGYEERDGRLGAMLFTRMTDTWTNQRDDMVKVSVTTLIRY